MFTAILADDEPIILRGLERIIDWKSLEIEIIGTALDGSEAMKLIETLKPDIFISDINMPKFSGIELLKQLKDKKYAPKVIFISGYQEFEYARDALKYGAVDYLLKPINEKQLTLALKSIIAEKIEKNGLEEHRKVHLTLIKDEKTDTVENDLITAKQHIINTKSYFSMLCCGFDNKVSEKDEDFEITLFSTMNRIEQWLEDIEGHWVFHKNKRIYILIYHEAEREVEALVSRVPNELIHMIASELGVSISVSTGKIVKEINKIKESYQMAEDGMELNYFYGKKAVINYQENRHYKYNLEDYYSAQIKILDSIMSYDKSKINRSVVYYMDIVKDISLWDKKSAINYCLATVVFIVKHIKDSVIQIENTDIEYIKGILNATCYYNEMIVAMSQYFEKILDEIASIVSLNESSEINKVKSYIQEHYNEIIKLETLADLVYMNPNYFSGYFKKHVGVKFKEYLTNIRINEAEKIMMSTDKKIYEIAEAVGFSDYRHFSEVFKKIKGKSPSDYKNDILKLK